MRQRSGGISRSVIIGYTLFFGLLPFGHPDGGGATYMCVHKGKFVKSWCRSRMPIAFKTMVMVIMALMIMICMGAGLGDKFNG